MSRFYLITLNTCYHCHTFLDNIWPELYSIIHDLGYRIQHHDVKQSQQRQWFTNNPLISQYVHYYPTLLIIDDENNGFQYEGDLEDIASIINWIYNTTI